MSYTPKPGSKCARALDVIRSAGPTKPADLAKAINCPAGNLYNAMEPAVRLGLAIRTVDGLYALPDGAPEGASPSPRPKRGAAGRKKANARRAVKVAEVAEEPAQPAPIAALWDSGDIIVEGQSTGPDTICLKEAAARQLHRFLTRIFGPVEA